MMQSEDLPSTGLVVAAVIVGYFPEFSVLKKLLLSLSEQVNVLILIDNGGSESIALSPQISKALTRYIKLEKNFGLGYALNYGFEVASTYNVNYVATFDQDSDPAPGLIANLLKTHLYLKKEGIKCAAVGPIFYDRREPVKKYFPFYQQQGLRITSLVPDFCEEPLVKVDVLITSGMLINMDVWLNGIYYDPGLFVDYTDTEWCFRVRSLGYSLFGHLKIEMGHALSEAPPIETLGLKFFEYSPVRRYYYFRNTVLICKLKFVTWVWKIRLMTGLFIRFFVNCSIDRKKLQSIKMMLIGLWHGFIGNTGEYRN